MPRPVRQTESRLPPGQVPETPSSPSKPSGSTMGLRPAEPGSAPYPGSTGRARGRRIALTLYYAVVALVGGAIAVQVTQQVFFEPAAQPPYATCQQGLQALFSAVARAREAAAGSEGGEDAALARFRSALEPEWTYRDGVASLCRRPAATTGGDTGTLDAIERLRYAEEHAVRREAGELAPLRRKVQALVDGELRR